MTSDPAIVGIEVISHGTLSAGTVRSVRAGDNSSREHAEALIFFAPEAKGDERNRIVLSTYICEMHLDGRIVADYSAHSYFRSFYMMVYSLLLIYSFV